VEEERRVAGEPDQGNTSVEEVFLQALHAEPGDETTWLALADWLEEDGQGPRAELVRLLRRLRGLSVLRRTRERARLEGRLTELLRAGVRPVVAELVNSLGMRLALVPAGKFRMGSPTTEADRSGDEGPLHEVEITQPFYLGLHPVTQAQWQAVMGNNPSHFSAAGSGKGSVVGLETGDFPAEQMSWEDVAAFLRKLSALPKERQAGRKYRLPTEAEWEYACRAGTTTTFHFGNTLSAEQANIERLLGRTCPVGSYRPNAFGLMDMHGNVYELCSDWYDEDYYEDSPRQNPRGPAAGSARVVRGGCWSNPNWACRSGRRHGDTRSGWFGGLGFRIALGHATA
jgi:uncharacterized protein (TIGR02996 family)